MTAGAPAAVRVWDGSNSVTNCWAGAAAAEVDLPLVAEEPAPAAGWVGGLGGLALVGMEKDSFF